MRANAPLQCPSTETLRLLVNFPDRWDGEHLGPEAAVGATSEPTAADAEHAGHGDGADVTPFSTYSESGVCPATHPVPIPMLQLAIDYPPVDPTVLSLASGSITTAHADFWNIWIRTSRAGGRVHPRRSGVRCRRLNPEIALVRCGKRNIQ